MKVAELYNGKVSLEFNDFSHIYNANGKRVMGVSTILKAINKPALVGWAAKVTAEYIAQNLKPGIVYDEVQIRALVEGAKKARWSASDKKASVGSLAHEWVHDWVKGKNPPLPKHKELRAVCVRFLRFAKSNTLRVEETERPVYSMEYEYAGRLDFIATMNGKRFVFDLKTGSGVWPESFFQTAAYARAFAEEFPKKRLHGTAVLNIPQEGGLTYSMHGESETQRDFDTFIAAFIIAKRLKELEE